MYIDVVGESKVRLPSGVHRNEIMTPSVTITNFIDMKPVLH